MCHEPIRNFLSFTIITKTKMIFYRNFVYLVIANFWILKKEEHLVVFNPNTIEHQVWSLLASQPGRKPPPLYSVLYGIISKRRCVLPRNFSLEKSQVRRLFISLYVHQQLHSLDCQWMLSGLFLPILGPLLVQGFILQRGPTIYKLFKNTISIGVCTLKCTEKRFLPFTPLHFLL